MKIAELILMNHCRDWLRRLNPEAKQEFIDAMVEFAEAMCEEQRIICSMSARTIIINGNRLVVEKKSIIKAPKPLF